MSSSASSAVGRADQEPGSASTSGSDPAPAVVQRLTRGALAWRVGALLVGVVLIVRGSVIGQDNDWPFGPMSQFAFRVGHDDAIHSPFLQARTARGEDMLVPITPADVGIARAEIEGELGQLVRHPAQLEVLMQSYHRLHPTRPALAQVWLRDRVTTLHDGRTSGVHIVTLVGWPDNDRQ